MDMYRAGVKADPLNQYNISPSGFFRRYDFLLLLLVYQSDQRKNRPFSREIERKLDNTVARLFQLISNI